MSNFIDVWTSPTRLKNGSMLIVKFTAILCALMIELMIAISAELITEALGMNEKTNKTDAMTGTEATRTNIKGVGSNSDRIYNHTDLKLLKNGGGSAW